MSDGGLDDGLCFGCETFSFWDEFLQTAAAGVHGVMWEPIQVVVMAAAGLYYAGLGGSLMLRGNLDVPKAITDNVMLLAGLVLLGDLAVLSMFIDGGMDLVFGLVGEVMASTAGGVGGGDIESAMRAVERSITSGITATQAWSNKGLLGLGGITGFIAGLLLFLPLFILELVFIAAVAEFVLKRFLVKAFGPMFFGALAFKATRPTAINTIRMLAQGGLNVLMVAVVVNGTMKISTDLLDVSPFQGDELKDDDYINSFSYWSYIAITSLSMIMSFKCASWSGQIVQFMESAGTAMALGAAAGKVMGAIPVAGQIVGKGMQMAAKHGEGAGRVAGQALRSPQSWASGPPPTIYAGNASGGSGPALPPPPKALPAPPPKARGLQDSSSGPTIYAPPYAGLLPPPPPKAPGPHSPINGGPKAGPPVVGRNESSGPVINLPGPGDKGAGGAASGVTDARPSSASAAPTAAPLAASPPVVAPPVQTPPSGHRGGGGAATMPPAPSGGAAAMPPAPSGGPAPPLMSGMQASSAPAGGGTAPVRAGEVQSPSVSVRGVVSPTIPNVQSARSPGDKSGSDAAASRGGAAAGNAQTGRATRPKNVAAPPKGKAAKSTAKGSRRGKLVKES